MDEDIETAGSWDWKSLESDMTLVDTWDAELWDPAELDTKDYDAMGEDDF